MLLIVRTALGEKRLDRLADRENKVVVAVETCKHEPNRRRAGAVARQTERATVEEIDQARVSEHEQVGPMVGGVVPFKLRDRRGDDRDDRQGQRIERLGAQPRLLDEFYGTFR